MNPPVTVQERDLGAGIKELRFYRGPVLIEQRRVEPVGATPVARKHRTLGKKHAKDGGA